MEIAKQTLKCGHMAPLAPDALYCHPIQDDDPFIFESMPHIYVIGNQPKFETCIQETNSLSGSNSKTRIVLLPKFAAAGQIVLINSLTLDIKSVQFQNSDNMGK